jgi:chaperonin cofactor prefoldin
MQMVTIDELEQRVQALELASRDHAISRQILEQIAATVHALRFEQVSQSGRLDTLERRVTVLQQDVGGLRNGLTDLRAHIDAKFHAAAGQIETIITLLKHD